MKLTGLTYLIILIFFKFFGFSQQSDYWGIKHIGAQDKPVEPIAIILKNSDTTNIKHNLKYYDKIIPPVFHPSVLDSTNYFFLNKVIGKYIKGINKKCKTKKEKIVTFGNIRVTHFVDGKSKSSFEIKDRQKSISFLLMLISNSDLLKETELSKNLRKMYCDFKREKDCW